MIVVDTSAVIAILLTEPDASLFRFALADSDDPRISALTDYEARLVALRRKGEQLVVAYEALAAKARLRIVPFDEGQSLQAFQAYRRYGKGSGHPAQLDLVDCTSYALAKNLDAPLLFKGAAFARTDIRRAL